MARGQETRLRSSCDRCHELKNRCARVGGLDSRCERCERLDIDCVYSGNARIGRPPGSNQKSNRERDKVENNPRSSKRQALSLGRQRRVHEVCVSPVDVNPDYEPDLVMTQAHYVANKPADKAGELDFPLASQNGSTIIITGDDKTNDPPAVTSPFQLGYGIHSWLDEHNAHPDLNALRILGVDDPLPLYDWAQPEEIAKSAELGVAANVTIDVCNDFNLETANTPDGPAGRPLVLHERLLQLQNHLGNIASKYHDAHLQHHQIPDDEALAAIKSLLDITQAFLSLGSQQHHLPAVLRHPSTSYCHVGILQLLTCYAYLLQILEPTVTRLVKQLDIRSPAALDYQSQSSVSVPSATPSLGRSSVLASNGHSNPSGSTTLLDSPMRPLLSSGADVTTATAELRLGCFTFASQPALTAELLLRSIYHMIAQTHNNVNLLALGRGGMTDGMEQQVIAETDVISDPKDRSAESLDMGFHFNPVIRSARAVMTVTHAQKRALFQRMKHLVD